MRKIISAFIVVTALYLSCSGGPDNTADDDDNNDEMQTEGMVNCPPPNTKMNVGDNRKFCGNDDCLIMFKDYWWWTNYQYTGDPNWYWNQGQSWSPRNPFVDSEGLHLRVKQDDLGGGLHWMASEVCAVYKSDKKTLANMGYGTYLVNAKMKTPSTFNALDKNVAFGVFTYQRDNSGPALNPHRELDLAEISRWGTPPKSNVSIPKLADGNAQFAVQLWDKDPNNNVQRYTIETSVSEITLVMYWNGAGSPVTFKQFNGTYNMDNLPKAANNQYTTIAEQNKYIPDNNCQLFHMNLWMGNYGEGDTHPPPTTGQVQEVVVTNFQYRAK